MTSLIEAIQKGDVQQVESLIKDDPTAIHSVGETGLGVVSTAIYYNEPDIARRLIQAGAPVTFHEHCALGNILEVKNILSKQPELINQFSVDGFQALGLAGFFGQNDVAEFLIKEGAEVNTSSKNPMAVRPLHSAVAARHMRISELLLEAGAEVDCYQKDGYTPLHEAAGNGQLEMVQLLLCFGAKKDVHLTDGRTPLDLAREKGFSEVANLLIK
jgi:ankyrin repeat protein